MNEMFYRKAKWISEPSCLLILFAFYCLSGVFFRILRKYGMRISYTVDAICIRSDTGFVCS